ncbi:MAG: Gfo/Idh/MocA family oxidoreductase, partial [Candidatus Hydrogenedentes bacterium]|nr:Gfo/Idh/MocA family oxidoreductase [Candidatus Hydrogenedentota bacterium]
MTPLRIGIVGLGGICRSRHIPGLRRIEAVEIAAVANRTRESSERAAREFAIPVVSDSWESLVARGDLDAVLIGAWPYLHHPVSIAALESGKHVFCQARMALNYSEAKEMRACAQRTGRVAMLCPVPIGLSVDATIARMLRDGALGAIRLVRAQSFSNAYASPGAPMNWRKDHRLSGLNMHTMGMFIEVVHRWFGWTRTVSAQTQIVIPERTDSEGQRVRVQIPDQVLINSELECGALAQYVFSAIVHQGQDRIEVFGEKASLRYDVSADTLEIARPERSWERVSVLPEDAYDLENWRVEQD